MSISLYYHPDSRASGALWALEKAGASYELQVIDLMKGEQTRQRNKTCLQKS